MLHKINRLIHRVTKGTGVLSDRQIMREVARNQLIDPCRFIAYKKRVNGGGSYGLEPFGYTLRLSDRDFRVSRDLSDHIVDPYMMPDNAFEYVEQFRHSLSNKKGFVIPAHSHALGVSYERFSIPDDIICNVFGKSSLIRPGILVGVTPLEPGWSGHITLEFSNVSNNPVILYPYEGVCQVQFMRGCPPDTDYAAGGGRYNNQPEKVVLTRASSIPYHGGYETID